MSWNIKESDWKYLKKLFPILVERACTRINQEAEQMLKNKENKSQHQLYSDVYNHYQEKDDMIADCFNDHKRSTALAKILQLIRHKIISSEEIEGFSGETQERIKVIRGI